MVSTVCIAFLSVLELLEEKLAENATQARSKSAGPYWPSLIMGQRQKEGRYVRDISIIPSPWHLQQPRESCLYSTMSHFYP